MICKNCGYDNDDKLYICENCGYPLYDEDDQLEEQNTNSDLDKTQVFGTRNIATEFGQTDPKKAVPVDVDDEDEEKKKKQSIAIIIALSVVLLAIIVGIIVGIAHTKNDEKPTTEIETSETTSNVNEDDNYDEPKTTEKSTTTTTTTTEAPTEATMLRLGLTCNNGGEVEGDGAYELGENVTVIARPDDGYEFGGWYNGGEKISTNTKYTFTITDNTRLKAVFILVTMEEEEPESKPEETTLETTVAQTTTEQVTEGETEIKNLEGADD